MQPPPEYGVDQLTGEEMIGGTVALPDGSRFRIKTKLITLIAFSKKLRDQTGDIANAVTAYFQQHAAEFKGATGANATDQQVASAVAAYVAANPPTAGKSVEIQKTATAIQARQTGGTWSDLVLLADLKGAPGAPGLTLVGTASVAETAAVLISSGQRQVANIVVTPASGLSVATGDPLMAIPSALPPSGYAIDNVIATATNRIAVSVQTPGLAIGATYNIPIKLYRLPA